MLSNLSHQILVDGRPDEALSRALVDFEVFESVRQESRFRVRFAVDVERGKITWIDDARLIPGRDREITIVAYVQNLPEVLVHGVIVGRELSLLHGGAGSSLDVLGADRRVVMDRNYSGYAVHSGQVSTIVRQILAKQGFTPDVESVESETFSEMGQSLSQTDSDLAFVQRLAARSGVEFWLSWELLPGGKVVETAHFRAQPERGRGGLVSRLTSSLVGSAPTLSINTGDASNTIFSFRSRRRADAPNRSGSISRVDADRGRITKTEVRGPDSRILGKELGDLAIERSVLSAGSLAEARRRAQAAINDSTWTIEASAETLGSRIGRLVRPRQIAQVQGTGAFDDGEYLVWAVQHRVDEVDHRMDIELRRNAVGEG